MNNANSETAEQNGDVRGHLKPQDVALAFASARNQFAAQMSFLQAMHGRINKLAYTGAAIDTNIHYVAFAPERLLEIVEASKAWMTRFPQFQAEVFDEVRAFQGFGKILTESLAFQEVLQGQFELQLDQVLAPLVNIKEPEALRGPLYAMQISEPKASGAHGRSIVEVTNLAGRGLVEFFAKNPEALRKYDRRRFEEFVAELFNGLGFRVELTARTKDGGKDIIAFKNQEAQVKYLIECKRPDPGNPVRVEQVRALFGVKHAERATKAILATTTYFTKDAQDFLSQNIWELEGRDFEGIQGWIRDYLEQSGGAIGARVMVPTE